MNRKALGRLPSEFHLKLRAGGPILGEMTRALVFPAILALWGVAVVVFGLAGGPESGNSSYESGGDIALVVGALMAAIGTFYFVRALRERS